MTPQPQVTLFLFVWLGVFVYCQEPNNNEGLGIGLDVEQVANGISGRADVARINANERRADEVFRDSDRAVEIEQALITIFGSNSDESKQTALITEAQAAELMESTGLEVSQTFDADGMPLTQEVANITMKVAEKTQCIFDKPNTDPCTSKFREHTGRCSHLEEGKRTWGMAGTKFARILPNRYEDGVRQHRTTEFSSNRTATSTRKISETVTDTATVLHRDFSTHVMQWGQFIAHEFTLIGELEEHIECCPDRIFREREGADATPTAEDLAKIRAEIQEMRGHVCIAIENEQDTVYGGYVCMALTRSTIAPNHDCSAGPRQQANLNTHLMDGSAIYGSSKTDADNLRSFNDGKMAVQTIDGRILPPANTDNCPASTSGRCPFKAGDIRINETPNLASLHAVFIVAHNTFAEELKRINPHWDDERIYQETRRIISGIESSIHYNEFLPLLLGNRIYNDWLDFYPGYDSSVNPSVLNEMGGAAMRFGHSIVEGDYLTIDSDDDTTINDLEEHFFDHDIVYELGTKAHLRGIQDAISRRVDRHMPTQMRNRLFRENRDIIAINLQRGRDHGFASYLDYLRHYGLRVPRSWRELRRTHPSDVVDALSQVYTTVEDIELYIGGVTEKPVRGGLLGPTFASILADGFKRLRDGDRLFYASEESGLTQEQREAIDSFSLAQLLCVGGDLSTVSYNAFFHKTASRTETVRCTSFPKFDFDLWRENEGEQNCHWMTVDMSKCCRGRKILRRECVGQSQNCRCPGPNEVSEPCSCPPSDYFCLINDFIC